MTTKTDTDSNHPTVYLSADHKGYFLDVYKEVRTCLLDKLCDLPLAVSLRILARMIESEATILDSESGENARKFVEEVLSTTEYPVPTVGEWLEVEPGKKWVRREVVGGWWMRVAPNDNPHGPKFKWDVIGPNGPMDHGVLDDPGAARNRADMDAKDRGIRLTQCGA